MNIWLDTGTLPGKLNMSIDEALFYLHKTGKSTPTLHYLDCDDLNNGFALPEINVCFKW